MRVAATKLSQSVRGWLAEASNAVASVWFPAGCRLCDVLLVHSSRVPICQECLASFAEGPAPICEICGRPQPSLAPAAETSPLCQVCARNTYGFERVRSYGVYEGALARAILLLKWERMDPLAAWFAERLGDLGSALAADVVAPVPLHRKRQKERGYNQAALISKPLARRLGLPHQELLLVRTKPRPDKQILTLDERWASVRGAFATRPGSQVDKRRVLLVDDVMTTGATLDACARALLSGGAAAVVGLTVARAARNPWQPRSDGR
ncbi:MAG TPA: ComF family protein [Candidatus Acidoferrum sp.]|nr:ComF family protein [Candidatus Acidoferrum sp.]